MSTGVKVAVAVSTGVKVAVAVSTGVKVAVTVSTGVKVAVAVSTGVFVAVSTGELVAVTVSVGVSTSLQFSLTTFVSMETAPSIANRLPSTVALVISVMEVIAIMVPAKSVDAPSVAELPTSQNTFAACAPLIRFTELPAAVIKVVVALNMKTALLSPPPSRVSTPVMPKVPES